MNYQDIKLASRLLELISEKATNNELGDSEKNNNQLLGHVLTHIALFVRHGHTRHIDKACQIWFAVMGNPQPPEIWNSGNCYFLK